MSESTERAASGRAWMRGALCLALMACAPLAQAEIVLAKDTVSFSGSQSYVYSMLAPSAGTMSVKVDDIGFPTSLEGLSFAVATTSGVLEKLIGEGELSFDISSAGAYYAVIAGIGVGRFSLGQASFSVLFAPLSAPVPLPGALVLLLSGLGGLGVMARRRSAVTARPSTPRLAVAR